MLDSTDLDRVAYHSDDLVRGSREIPLDAVHDTHMAVQQQRVGEVQSNDRVTNGLEQPGPRRPGRIAQPQIQCWIARGQHDAQIRAGAFRYMHKQQAPLLRIGVQQQSNDLALELRGTQCAAYMIARIVGGRQLTRVERFRPAAEHGVVDLPRPDIADVEPREQFIQPRVWAVGRKQLEEGARVAGGPKLHSSRVSVLFGDR